MKKFPVFTSASVVCDANGAGTVRIGPNTYGHTWEIHLVSITNTSVVNQSQFFLYLGAASPSLQIGGSWSGNLDQNSDTITLRFGDQLVGVWSGADAGSTSMMLISGTGTDVR
jgi:hypothetical protein